MSSKKHDGSSVGDESPSKSNLLYQYFKVRSVAFGLTKAQLRARVGMGAKYFVPSSHRDFSGSFPMIKKRGKTFESAPAVGEILQGFNMVRGTDFLTKSQLFTDEIEPLLEFTTGTKHTRKIRVVRKRLGRFAHDVAKALRKLQMEEHYGPGTRAVTYTVWSIKRHFLYSRDQDVTRNP